MSSPRAKGERRQTEAMLPIVLVTQADVTRLLRELEGYDEIVSQRALAKVSARTRRQPVYHSQALHSVADELGFDLGRQSDRQELLSMLRDLRQSAPVADVHFAVEPTSAALGRLAGWLRREIHSQILIDVSVRPSIVGGCAIRLGSRYFDYSLSAGMERASQDLRKRLRMAVRT